MSTTPRSQSKPSPAPQSSFSASATRRRKLSHLLFGGITGSQYAKGLVSVGGSGSNGYAYREGDVYLGSAGSYSSSDRGGTYTVGLGSLFADGTATSGTAISPSTKVYQFFYISEYLNQTEMTNLESAVNTLQSDLDTIYGTNRNNRS